MKYMNRLTPICSLVFMLAFALPAYGRVMYRIVTPDSLTKDRDYLFSVSTKATKDGVDFHVTITSKKGDIPPGSTVFFEVWTFTNDGDVASGSPPKTEIPFAVKRDGKALEVDFSVTREQLKEPGLCLEFPVDMGYDDYVIKLQDFLKK
jgi:hypothetical protein